MKSLRTLLAILPLCFAMTTPGAAQQKFPTAYPIRVMLPFAAGSVSDVTLRILADKLSTRLGTAVIIDNQPRAGGITAATATMSANPDGYTLVVLSSSTAISVSLLKHLPYDPMKDFVPVSGASTFANILATSSTSKHASLADFMKAAREKPGTLNVGTTTVGSTNHLAATLFRSMTGLDFVIVPFRTPGDLVTAAIRNDVDAIIQSYGALKSAVEEKQLRALAGTTAARTPYAPNVPTVDELGVKGFEVVTWNGFFAPAKTPPDVVALLNREIGAALADPDLKKRFLDLGLEPLPEKPVELGNRMKTEIAKWAKVIDDAKIEKQ